MTDKQPKRKRFGGFTDGVGKVTDGVKSATASVTDATKSGANATVSATKSSASATVSATKSGASAAADATKSGIGAVANATGNAFAGGKSRASDVIAVIDGSVLLARVDDGFIDTVKTKATRLAAGRENDVAAASFALHGVMNNLANATASLDGALLTKFKYAGISGRGVGTRSDAEAQALYDASVPDHVKMLSDTSHDLFLHNKDASHIQSYHNDPSLAKSETNIVWESASANRSRGAADMTATELANVNRANALQGFALGVGEIAARSALWAIAIEATISITENTIYVYRGHRDLSTAVQDTLVNTAKAGAIGAVAGVVLGVVTTGVVAAGGGAVLMAIAPAVAVAGGALLVYSAGNRIHKALTTPIYDDGGIIIIGTDIVRCCEDCDDLVTDAELVAMLEDPELELAPVSAEDVNAELKALEPGVAPAS